MDFLKMSEDFIRENTHKRLATEEDVKNYPYTVLGEPFETLLPIHTKEDALKWVERYYGPRIADSEVRAYIGDFPIELKPLNDQLDKINEFIKEADKINSYDAVKGINRTRENSIQYEYVKWKIGHYRVAGFFGGHLNIPDDLKRAYGKYVLFKEWLEEEIHKLSDYTYGNEDLKSLSVFEITKRQLNTIWHILHAQFSKLDDDVDGLLNEDGRYCTTINVRSEQEWELMPRFRQHYTERYELISDRKLIFSELVEIYRQAENVIDFYGKAYTKENIEVKISINLLDQSIKEQIEKNADYRTMIVLLENYNPTKILFGLNARSKIDGKRFSEWKFNELLVNGDFTDFCGELINYINDFDIDELQRKDYDHEKATKLLEIYAGTSTVEKQDLSNKKPSVLKHYEDNFDLQYFQDDESYENAKKVLISYLDEGILLDLKISFKKLNMKAIGWKFNLVFIAMNKKIGVDFLRFAKSNINLYHNCTLDECNWKGSTFYNYFHAKIPLK